MGRAERERRGDPQASAKFAGGEHRFPGHVDLRAGPGCVVPKNSAGFRECGAARGSRKKLDAKFRLKAHQPPADDGLGQAKPARSRRDAARIGDLHEGPQLLDIHPAFPDLRHSMR
jgi:hypothetical protein